MTHRRIEFVIPADRFDDMQKVFEDAEILDRADQPRNEDDDRARVNVVVEDSSTEHLIDRFRDVFGEQRIGAYIYEIAGVYPKPENHEKQESVKGEPNNRVERVSREELLSDLAPGSVISKIYLAQVFIATVVAAAGMMRGSVVLVIAGMMIAPLLLPNMSVALGTTLGDLRMIRQAVLTGLAGLALAFAASLACGLTIPFDVGTEEIAARSYVSMADIVIALAAGAAGAVAVTMAVSPGLVGVMVAVALLPPVVAAGLFTGGGYYEAAWGAAVLTATNLVCVNLAAVVVFLASGIRPQAWAEEKNARRASITAMILWVLLLIAVAGLIWKAAPNVPIKPQSQDKPPTRQSENTAGDSSVANEKMPDEIASEHEEHTAKE